MQSMALGELTPILTFAGNLILSCPFTFCIAFPSKCRNLILAFPVWLTAGIFSKPLWFAPVLVPSLLSRAAWNGQGHLVVDGTKDREMLLFVPPDCTGWACQLLSCSVPRREDFLQLQLSSGPFSVPSGVWKELQCSLRWQERGRQV